MMALEIGLEGHFADSQNGRIRDEANLCEVGKTAASFVASRMRCGGGKRQSRSFVLGVGSSREDRHGHAGNSC